MLAPVDNLFLAADSLRAHKLRAVLTMVGLTMGVATLITVMTIVQGANLYVEQKVANLGTDVFQVEKLGERMDVMLKPMDGLLKNMRGVAGTTLLGDGRVLIVLDVQELFQ